MKFHENFEKVVVYNTYGNFKIYDIIYKRMEEMGYDISKSNNLDIRTNKFFIKAVEEHLNDDKIKNKLPYLVLKIPSNVDWILQQYDGWEWISEKHKIWGDKKCLNLLNIDNMYT